MNKPIKRVLVAGMSLLMMASAGAGLSSIKAHGDAADDMAEVYDMRAQNDLERLQQSAYQEEAKARFAQDEVTWAKMEAHEPHLTYDQILGRQERPLSEIYPNGHWNGMSDIKGDNTNYKKLNAKRKRAERKQKQAFRRYYNSLKSKDASQINAQERKLTKEKKNDINKLNAIINKMNQQERAKQRYSRRWYKKHTYSNHSRWQYLSYQDGNKGFSNKQWRYAFPEGADAVDKIGLTRSYKAVMKSANGPDNPVVRYKADAVVRPGQLVQMKLIKRVGKYAYVYRAKFRGRYYYYTNDCDKWGSEITPFTAEYYKGDFQSVFKPWTYKRLYLNKSHKLRNGSEWDYNPGNDNDTYYKLKNGRWHETNYSYTAPTNLDE